jgi:hypothetical protein
MSGSFADDQGRRVMPINLLSGEPNLTGQKWPLEVNPVDGRLVVCCGKLDCGAKILDVGGSETPYTVTVGELASLIHAHAVRCEAS